MKIGDIIECWNYRSYDKDGNRVFTNKGKIKGWQKAKIVNIETNVKSTFDDHVYPILYDVLFIEENLISEGHLPHALREVK